MTAGEGSEGGPGTTMRVVAVGDAIISHRIGVQRTDERFADMCSIIGRADAASVNLETNLFHPGSFTGWPAAERGGSYLVGPPGVADDLAEMGFNLFARANNHAADWGIEGLLTTGRILDERGLLHAGVGRHLAESAKPTYLDTARGRVAMISLTTTVPVSHGAGPQRHDVQGRPGCNGVQLHKRLQLPSESHAHVREAMDRYGSMDVLRLAGFDLVEGDEPSIVEQPSDRDLDRVFQEIEKAAAFADVVLVNGHTHEPANPIVQPPAWLVDLARACIDAGAHAYLGHGPHQLRPAEIYRGRPIFYSLGNFVCHRDTQDPLPAEQYRLFGLSERDARPDQYVATRDGSGDRLGMTQSQYYESVMPDFVLRDGELSELRLHPLDLGLHRSAGGRGTARLARPEHGEAILSRMAELSAGFDFAIDVKTGFGQLREL